MHAETPLIQEDAAKSGHWIKVANVSYKNTNPNSRFFYIGQTDEAIQALSVCFASGIIVKNFAEAREQLVNTDVTSFQPDVIFIDIPLLKPELEAFCSFLIDCDLLSNTPVIYNERKLDFSNIKLLQSLQLIDDVVDLTSDSIDYCSKIAFIKKIKSHVSGKITGQLRPSVYGINTAALRSYAARRMQSSKKIFFLQASFRCRISGAGLDYPFAGVSTYLYWY